MTMTDSPTKYRYEGNGITDTFAYSSKAFTEDDIIVEIITRATDVLAETLTLSTHYDVNIADDGTASIVVTAPSKIPSSSQDIQIRRALDQTQTVSLPTGTKFPAKAVENAIDRAVGLVQDLEEVVDRSLKFPVTSSTTEALLPEPVDDCVLVFDGLTGQFKTGVTNASLETVGEVVADAQEILSLTEAARDSAIEAAASVGGLATLEVNLADFDGADPTGATSSATAIQNAINIVDAAGGGIVNFRAGRWLIDAQIIVPSHVCLRGEAYDFPVHSQATANATGLSGTRPRTSLQITYGAGTSNPAFLMRNFAKARNFHIAYPNQSLSAMSPTQYGPPFGGGGANALYVDLENIYHHNSYVWWDVDTATCLWGGGKFSYIRGQCIHRGIVFDRMTQPTFVDNIHSILITTDNIATYAKANAILFDIGYADDIHFNQVFGWGLKNMFNLRTGYNNGAAWANATNITADSTQQFLVATDYNTFNISAYTAIGPTSGLTGAALVDVQSVSFPSARMTLTGGDFYNAAHAVRVAASSGTVIVDGYTLKTDTADSGAGRYDGNNIRGAAIIDEGNGAIVKVLGVGRGGRRQWEHIFGPGGESFQVDGITIPNRGTDITPSGWDDKANWSGTTTNMSNITGGLRFDMVTTAQEVTFPLGNTISREGCGVIEFIPSQVFGQAVVSAAEFSVSIIDGAGVEITRMFDSGFVPHYELGYKYIFPFFCDPNVTTCKLKVKFGGLTTGTGTIDFTSLKIYRSDRQYMTNPYFNAVYGTERYATTNGQCVKMNGHNKVIIANQAPTAGVWVLGDEVEDVSPTLGDAPKLLCTTAGTPGTWTRSGNLRLQGSGTWDPGDLADGAGETSSAITVTGAALGDFVIVSAPYDLQGITCNGYVSAANEVKIRLQNETGGNINLASGTWRAMIIKL